MMAHPQRAGNLRKVVATIASQVDRLNLVLNAFDAMPNWVGDFSNLNTIMPSEDLASAGKFCPRIEGGDLVFLMDSEISYPADYVAHMLKAFDNIAIDRKVIGVGGTIYSDFFDGQASSQIAYPAEEKLAKHQFVNQLNTGTVLCRGADLPPISSMKNSEPFEDLRFAVHCFRNAVPMICIAHDSRWLKDNRRPAQPPMPVERVNEAQQIAGFGRLPIALLGTLGRIPSRTQPAANIPVRPITLLNPKSAVTKPDPGKPRMTVVSWSLGSNAAGRAYTLDDLAASDFNVELAGTLIPSRGREIWPPLRDATIPIRGFIAEDMASCLSSLRDLVQSSTCDIIYVSKPRFPSLLLGMLLSAENNCPLLLDIDDLELSFIRKRSPLRFADLKREFLRDSAQLTDPASETWTRFSETLVGDADAVTLSNEALQRRYSGTVVRHARDEAQFFPDDVRRKAIRNELGFSDNQTVILFIGTLRPHKGLTRIATAIAARGDDNLVLCIIGSDDEAAMRKQLGAPDSKSIRVFPPQSLARLADLTRAGDAVSLLQDSSSSISDFQIPAKLSEALAMGLPVLASRVAPFADLIAAGAVRPIDTDAELQQALDDIKNIGTNGAAQSAKRRNMFLAEFSFAANRPRLRQAVATARERHARAPHARDATLRQIADYLESCFGIDVLNRS